jgi:transcriptional regulator with XRE-family HTH domain
LRREEVAQIAGVSVAYYTWLEQARDLHVSKSVLENIAKALQLSVDERLHLFQLANQLYMPEPSMRRESINPLLQRMLDNQGSSPALLVGHYCDLLAWNRVACEVFCDFETIPEQERNLVWLIFTHKGFRQRIVNWEEYAQDATAVLRSMAGRFFVEDTQFVQLSEMLKRISPEFQVWWSQHDVREVAAPRQEIDHPLVGRLVFDRITLQVSTSPDLRMCVYLAAPESDTAEKLGALREMNRSFLHLDRCRNLQDEQENSII